jgi:hypothetical protein
LSLHEESDGTKPSTAYRLEYAADFLKILDIPRLGLAGDFVQPTYGRGFKARLIGIVREVDNFHFDLDGILASLYPPLSFFASL